MDDRIDTLLVTGFLGAGKTTLLSGWLARRPADERWAVLVNEFGALGVDRALLGGDVDGAVAVAEVAGGCACCAARVAFGTTLARLLRRGPWDRLLVETTGLGHPAALVDRLRAPDLAPRLRLRPPVAVVDAGRAALYFDPARTGHDIATDQVALARLLVLNRAGDPSSEAVRDLAARLAGLPPWPREVIPTAGGTVPLEAVLAALDRLEGDPAGGPGPAGGPQASGPNRLRVPGPLRTPGPLRAPPPPPAIARGWRWPASEGFDRVRLQATLEALTAGDGPLRACGLLRGKGVFRTERAWYGWQWADGRADWHESAWRADNRLEVLAERAFDPQMVDEAIRTAAAKG